MDAAKYPRKRAHVVSVVNRDAKELTAVTVETGDADHGGRDVAGGDGGPGARRGTYRLSGCLHEQSEGAYFDGGVEYPPEDRALTRSLHHLVAGTRVSVGVRRADPTAREHVLRASPRSYGALPTGWRRYSPPHHKLSREDRVLCRQL